MNREELRELIRLVEESEIDELEIKRWGRTVRIVKNAVGAARPAPAAGTATPAPTPAREPAEAEEAPGAEAPAEETAGEETELHVVESPMVGTFYRAPSPEAPPFVEVGDSVRPGQTLCILEAMKLMNELQSEVSGTVREVLVDNAEPVEYGQALFRIETA
ncbi:MAG: acetyl-CoA carboxylase biotin carboxyl carrier protein [Gemmatimonadota bacterium]|nr:acetyl-CoA carboxylase biotin carboxyl carrier protein [Gemmatimonadota bacterium]